MTLSDAQREVRSVFLGGSIGQLVTGAIWLISAALSTWAGERQGIIALFLGGMLIFPLTQLSLRLIGRPGTLGRDNPLSKKKTFLRISKMSHNMVVARGL